ncbi:MAG: M61 family metallopeptidase [bacterium]
MVFASIHHDVKVESLGQYLIVDSFYDLPRRDTLDLMMATWTPGSYLIREYQRKIESVELISKGKIEKTSKNHWLISNYKGVIHLRYKVKADQLSVRTSYVADNFAFIHAASCLMFPTKAFNQTQTIKVQAPPNWSVHSILEVDKNNSITAPNWAALVDNPILAGQLDVISIPNKKIPFELINTPGNGQWVQQQLQKDLSALLDQLELFWGNLPFEHYRILNMIEGGRGGLEHLSGTVLMAKPWQNRNRDDYVSWLNLVSHEMFHAWNVRRLRPESLRHVDFEHESYTRELWLAEGFTSYYQGIILLRAGLITLPEYLKDLAKRYQSYQLTPGHLVQSPADASFDAWIKQYRPDSDSRNSRISYYTAGAMIAFALDDAILSVTHSKQSLDSFMRKAYSKFPLSKGYNVEKLIYLSRQLYGKTLAKQFRDWIYKPESIDIEPILQRRGLILDKGKNIDQISWIGSQFERANPQLLKNILKDSPLWKAGIQAGDELIAINKQRVSKNNINEVLNNFSVGDTVEVIYSRRGLIKTTSLTTQASPGSQWKIKLAPSITRDQKKNLQNWLKIQTKSLIPQQKIQDN